MSKWCVGVLMGWSGTCWRVTRGGVGGEWGIRMLGAGTCGGYVGRGRCGYVGGHMGVTAVYMGVRMEGVTCVGDILGGVSGVGGRRWGNCGLGVRGGTWFGRITVGVRGGGEIGWESCTCRGFGNVCVCGGGGYIG